jgi:16S rRNA (guanine1207-N2)-methyltransferase
MKTGGINMTEHYYTKKPVKKSQRSTIKEEIRGIELVYTVDEGVFSKRGVDFGSKMLIENLKEPDISGAIIDVGCGWGPMGLTAAAAFPERMVHMVDINERSVALSRENAERNKLRNVKIYEQDLLESEKEESFAAVITNPPIRAGKDVVFKLYEEAWRVLKSGGELTLVIQKKQGAASTKKKLEELGFEVENPARSKGYFIFTGKKH